MILADGSLVGHFRLHSTLGAGGMGVVYLAEDINLKRQVALKFLAGSDGDGHANVRRLIREAQITSGLDHPNIATVYEIGEWQSVPFIALAYCAGETVKQRIARGPLPIAEIVSILRQVAEGMAHAHAAGVVHRDLKPSNIMVGPDGHVRILDFGLAQLLATDAPTVTRITQPGTTAGTLAYMAPEQLRGEEVDARADIWALGATLFEMVTGRLPFDGDNLFAVMQAVLDQPRPSVLQLRPETPAALANIVDAALQKDREARRLSASEIVDVARGLQSSTSAPKGAHDGTFRRVAVGLAALLTVAIVAGGWFVFNRSTQARIAREQTLPEVVRLAQREQYWAAFALARQAQRWLPNDSELQRQYEAVSRTISIDTVPAGAEVRYRPYGAQAQPWQVLGQTPIRDLRIPRELLEFRIEKPGYAPVEDVGLLARYLTLVRLGPDSPHTYMLETADERPPGMVRASPRGLQLLAIAGLEHVKPFELADFWIDRYEVTNRAFKAFVDAGGYRERRFWKHPFVKAGKPVTWEAAMADFRDSTGRAGPSTWELGTYPEGKDDFPVGGVSWYEAAAYAEFVGKSLPTIFHWSVVADRRATSPVLLPRGRYASDGPVAVGSAGAISRYGTHDLAGNNKEWCQNEAGEGRRYTLGGGWSDPAYFFNDADGRSPWDRSPALGFRTMKVANGTAVASTLGDPVPFFFRDFSRERPASDDVFRAYLSLYSYDRTELGAKVRSTDDSARDWRHETVELNAAYSSERMTVHVFLPKRASPPFQTLVYFPGINALHQRSSADGLTAMLNNADFVVRSGRALAYPIYKATHERQTELTSDFPSTSTLFRDHVLMWSKDLQRTVDYLQTRSDIAPNRIGYLGRSWGAAMGTIMVATEPRLKLAIFFVGGFYFQHGRPEVEAVNFAPRVRVPSLMLNGRYDFFFPVDASQRYMFKLIGVPESQKRWVVYETSHSLPRVAMVEETLRWIDQYFGPVATR
jgi:dienelactone hydrolase